MRAHVPLFVYGTPVSDEHFTDRESETAFLVRRMTAGANVIVTSPRRYGKTSLLRRAAAIARRDHGARVGIANFLRATDGHSVAEELTRAVVGGALGWLDGSVENVRDRLGSLSRIVPVISREGFDVSLARVGSEPSFASDIKRAVELLADSAEDRVPVSLVLDEFQQVAEAEPSIPGVFKAVCDEVPGVSLVFSGSRRHMVERIFDGSGAPLKGVGERLSLERIPEPDMCAFVIGRMRLGGLDPGDAAIAALYRAARGVPHVVQAFAASVAEMGRGRVDVPTVAAAIAGLLSRSRSEMAVAYEMLTTNQRRVVDVLAERPVPDLTSRRSLAAFGISSAAVVRVRSALYDQGVIEHGGDGWHVADPVFELWLRHGRSLDLGEGIDARLIERDIGSR